MWENPCLVLCKEVMALDFSKYKTCFASQQNPGVSVWKKEQLCFYNDVSETFILFHHSWYNCVVFVVVVLTSGFYLV